jgi:hypothetical protein
MTAFNSEFSISHSFSKVIPTKIINQIVTVDFQMWPDLNDMQINTQLLFCQNSTHILEEFIVHLLFHSEKLKFKKHFDREFFYFFFWSENQVNIEFFKNVTRILTRRAGEINFNQNLRTLLT